jgi:tetratricopeptide (TPR) repeat protein
MKNLLLFLLIIPFWAKAQDLEKLMTFYGEGQFEKAIAFGEEVLKKDSNNIETNLMIGRAYTDLGSYNKAIGYLQKATSDTIVQKWKPAWANAYLGTCYFALGNFEMSKKHYEASIALKATKNCDRYTLRRYPSLPIVTHQQYL